MKSPTFFQQPLLAPGNQSLLVSGEEREEKHLHGHSHPTLFKGSLLASLESKQEDEELPLLPVTTNLGGDGMN